ncbi:MAG: hypothetical protein RL671_2270 [Pseudomonadota bacterium]|jgi:hypothetical protein
MPRLKPLLLPALLALPGCGVAGAAVDLASAPVRVVKTGSTVVDKMTTSQAEKDQKRGREIRRREEQIGELERDYRKQSGKCQSGDEDACRKADRIHAEMRALMPSVPYEAR